LTFRNRVGIAAGFDKNATALAGTERLGLGFVEVGTILAEPWGGNAVARRVRRLPARLGIWNRLGFPSDGLAQIQPRLEAFSAQQRRGGGTGMVMALNIGPHPGNLMSAANPQSAWEIAVRELTHLVRALHGVADLFVVNLSSPNTRGLRAFLQHEQLASGLFWPLRQELQALDVRASRKAATRLLLKLPPEDADKRPWTQESLSSLVEPLLDQGGCDGFVAVNSSTRLAAEAGEDAGGISGAPLLPIALETIVRLKAITGDRCLLIGCGGITGPNDAVEFVEAGADLVEIYSGLIYRGPMLVRQCALALKGSREQFHPSLGLG
jgi:dihydroorotate dehydrogenase